LTDDIAGAIIGAYQNKQVVKKMAASTRSVTSAMKKAGKPVELVNSHAGYFYFVYDDAAKNIWESESVYVCFFSHLPIDRWIDIGLDFALRVEAERMAA